MQAPWFVGEKLFYQVTALGITAADLAFEVVEQTEIFNLPAWHFKVSATTHGFLKRIHNYDIQAESYLHTESFKSLEWQTDIIEGKQTKLCLERHLPDQQKYFTYRQTDGIVEHQETRDFIHPEHYSDLFSFFYILRAMKPQDIIYLVRNYESKPVTIPVVIAETLNFNGKRVACEKLTIHFDGREHTVWREIEGTKRILKAQVTTSFASGTALLKI